MYITVLCKVVDNYGDIGVAWRLCRRLTKIQSKYKICLIVDDLKSFNMLEPKVDIGKGTQTVEDVEVFRWDEAELCKEVFFENDGERLGIILELFQCGRPEWMEDILFNKKLERTVQIIMIDYLTAEKYAEDFHCLKSLTRSSRVQKVNFMPGFTDKTGGLIIDEAWERLPPYNPGGPVLEFTYKTKGAYLHPVESLGSAGSLSLSKGLPFMPQSEWDDMMKTCSALIVRGEESMSRACLSGIPFIWQAYPQTEEYQLVKVKALLGRMRPHFSAPDFEIVEKAWLFVNVDCHALRARNDEDPSLRGANAVSDAAIQNFLNARHTLVPFFQDFACSLQKNGDLCANLMTFIDKIAII